MIPDTIYRVFSQRWIDINHSPADAPEWLEQGYLSLEKQGKASGYVVTRLAYELIVDQIPQSED
jgi:hypothetical protein